MSCKKCFNEIRIEPVISEIVVSTSSEKKNVMWYLHVADVRSDKLVPSIDRLELSFINFAMTKNVFADPTSGQTNIDGSCQVRIDWRLKGFRYSRDILTCFVT